MLSYRHSFHAGNFADVLKHIILVEILEHLVKKDKPFTYIDTHAGAGIYDLQSDFATKLNEADEGIHRLDPEVFPELRSYLEAVNTTRSSDRSSYYPGSPLIARSFLRSQDSAWLYELHPTDFEKLQQLTQDNPQIQARKKDGFKGLIKQVPPQSRRGLILIDPSYEIKTDYETVFRTIQHAHRKFSTGTYALWYPVVDRERIQQMENRFIKSGIKDIQRFELGMRPDSSEPGMTASGLIVINPPWKLMEKMRPLLPKLKSSLGTDEGAFSRCDILVGE